MESTAARQPDWIRRSQYHPRDGPRNPLEEAPTKAITEAIIHHHTRRSDHRTQPHPVLFDKIDGLLIRSTVLRMDGAAGPSGLDAAAWKRMCTSFKSASTDLCKALAAIASLLRGSQGAISLCRLPTHHP